LTIAACRLQGTAAVSNIGADCYVSGQKSGRVPTNVSGCADACSTGI
jgi:hypothetical protein